MYTKCTRTRKPATRCTLDGLWWLTVSFWKNKLKPPIFTSLALFFVFDLDQFYRWGKIPWVLTMITVLLTMITSCSLWQRITHNGFWLLTMITHYSQRWLVIHNGYWLFTMVTGYSQWLLVIKPNWQLHLHCKENFLMMMSCTVGCRALYEPIWGFT